MESEYFRVERERMVEQQIAGRGIRSPGVLEAMRSVPRHEFVPARHRDLAYTDGPLPIGSGQTISQPYIVALMTELLQPGPGQKVLEIGTGSGYQAAVLAQLVGEVHTVERIAGLGRLANRILRDLGIENVHVHIRDGSLGLPEQAPFDGIIVTAAAPSVADELLEQLNDPGRMVVPVGSRGGQTLQVWERRQGRIEFDLILPVAFVPLIGQGGWKDERQFDY